MTPEMMFSFDFALASFLTCVVLRDVFVLALPERVAGPGGCLVDTDRDR